MKKQIATGYWLLIVVVMLGIVACESDDSDGKIKVSLESETTTYSEITGTAAAGAPIDGYVRARGANGKMAYADISSDGSFGLDVSELTTPYLLKAKGTVYDESITVFSTGVAGGVINITPLTDYIATRILDDPENAFNSWSTDSEPVDDDAIETEETAVQEQLAPILEAYGVTDDIDLQRTEFETNRTGLDAVLDIIDIDHNSSNEIAITNRATGTSIASDEKFSDDEKTALAGVISDTAAMNIFWSKLDDAFADGSASSIEITDNLAPLVASDYFDDGETKSDFLNTIAGLQGNFSFSMAIDRVMSSSEFAGTYSRGYWIYLLLQVESNTIDIRRSSMVYDGTDWLLYGNQMWFRAEILPVAKKMISSDATTTFTTGIYFSFAMKNNYAYNEKGVRSLIVTGTGLPDSGLVFQVTTDEEEPGYYQELEDDTIIQTIPENAEYTVSAYDVSPDTVALSDTPLKTFTVKSKGVPYQNAELTTAKFPVFVSHTTHSLSDLDIGSEITVNWTLPTDLDVGWKNRAISILWQDGVNEMEVVEFLNLVSGEANDTSVVLDTSNNNMSEITWATISLEGFDVYGQMMTIEWEYE